MDNIKKIDDAVQKGLFTDKVRQKFQINDEPALFKKNYAKLEKTACKHLKYPRGRGKVSSYSYRNYQNEAANSF